MTLSVRTELAAEVPVAGFQHIPSLNTGLPEIASRYPLTAATLLSMPNGRHSLEHIASLDQRWEQARHGSLPAGALVVASSLPQTQQEFDIIYAGGGLSLFSATIMAQAGYRVLVFDQRRVGAIHRMWNISERELAALVSLGFCSWADLEPAILRRYERSFISVHPTASNPERRLELDKVLDLAIDAKGLLALARRRFQQAGGTILDERQFCRVTTVARGAARVVVELEAHDARRESYGARLLINAMGSLSPLTLALHGGLPFRGVCPTVGTIARGFRQGSDPLGVDLTAGEVLVSIDQARDGRQLLWEGFPGQADELTVYLFYYDRVGKGAAQPQSLLALFEDYFRLLPSYKEPGPDFEHLRPLYGFIPARYAAVAQRERPGVARAVLSIGDSAGEQSALTFCGFGSHIRNLGRICELTDYVLRNDLLEAAQLARIGARQQNLRLHGFFSQFMQPWEGLDDVNYMLGSVCEAMNQLDAPTVRRFFQDRSSLSDYVRILWTLYFTAPEVVSMAARSLGWRDSLRCLRTLVGYPTSTILRLPALLLEWPSVERVLKPLDCFLPQLSLRLRSLQTALRAMRDS